MVPGLLEPPRSGSGAYSVRLADIDASLLRAERLHGEILALLERVEAATTRTDESIEGLLAVIRRHPLMSKFLGG